MNKLGQVAVATFAAVALTYAQGPGGPPPHAGFGPGPFGPGGFGARWGKIVTGAPYSATVTSQFTQTLAGGNTIQRTNTAQVARDSQGRTYEQQTITSGPLAQNGAVTLTFITDPVAGYSYSLNPQTKIATRHVLHTPPAGASNRPPRSPEAESGASPNRAITDLGTQTMNGVTVQGKRSTHSIAAGEIGNAQPIVSTNETWYSPDLQIIVMAKRNDPMTGQATFAVTDIKRADPAASLFQVPSDYTIQDATNYGGFRGRRGPGGPPPPQE